jgi:hypothetical protein
VWVQHRAAQGRHLGLGVSTVPLSFLTPVREGSLSGLSRPLSPALGCGSRLLRRELEASELAGRLGWLSSALKAGRGGCRDARRLVALLEAEDCADNRGLVRVC